MNLQNNENTFARKIVSFEMESVSGDNTERILPSSNVQLGEVNMPEQVHTEQICENNTKRWYNYSSNEVMSDFSNIMDRYFLLDTIEWSTGRSVSNNYVLPKDILTSLSSKVCDNISTIPFHTHAFWRGDIEVRIQINSNKFQCGMLIIGWCYQYRELSERLQQQRQNAALLTQLPHVIVSAGACNEAVLHIPFRYCKSFINTTKNNVYDITSDMGTLFVGTLSALRATTTPTTVCNVSIFTKFTNCKFTGMRCGDIAYPEMEAAIDIGERLLRQTLCDRNRDNPPSVVAPNYVVPTASHSWSVGTNISAPLHPLRLDGIAQTTHEQCELRYEAMQSSDIFHKFNMFSYASWRFTMLKSHTLFKIPVCPFMSRKNYERIGDDTSGMMTNMIVPGVGILSSMFAYWRGSLEFRFDLVASSFHTGRLIVGFVPMGKIEDNFSLMHLRNSMHAVFSLTDNTSFTFEVPYVYDKSLCPVNDMLSYTTDYWYTGVLVVAVLNPLACVSDVSQTIDIMAYVRGGADFELAVPRQPRLTFLNSKYGVDTNKLVLPRALSLIHI